MALITLAEPFKSFRGRDATSGGQVLYPALGRDVSRSFVQPANPSTIFQDAIRALFAALSQGYSLVSDANNVGWITLAQALLRRDADGRPIKETPKSAYIIVGFWNTILGNAISAVAPTYASVPGIFSLDTVKRNVADTGWQFAYSWDGANTQIALKATAPLPGLRRQPRGRDYRFSTDDPTLSIFPITNAGGTITILDTISRYNYVTGNRIGIKAQVISDDALPLQVTEAVSVIAAP